MIYKMPTNIFKYASKYIFMFKIYFQNAHLIRAHDISFCRISFDIEYVHDIMFFHLAILAEQVYIIFQQSYNYIAIIRPHLIY